MTRSPMTMGKDRVQMVGLAEQLRSGNVRALSRLITLIESEHPDREEGLRVLDANVSATTVVGITGYPGAGKSTLINALVRAYRRLGMRVAVLAIDVSSVKTGGALLGDRIRMHEHAMDPGVYIRSMASRGHHGGVASAAGEAARVLAAAGYEIVLIETVGVGQSEGEITHIAPIVIAVVAPGLGDEIQAMKAGLLEIADIIVVNKSDASGADTTLRDLREWWPIVIGTVATTGEGVSELVAAIAAQQARRRSTDSTYPFV